MKGMTRRKMLQRTGMIAGGAVIWALYTAVLGIQADFQGITLEPHVPAALADVRTELRLLGRQVTFRFRGNGDKLESLALNGKPARGNRLSRSELNDGAEMVAVLSAAGSRPRKK
jgi:cellobiose phosphorylase